MPASVKRRKKAVSETDFVELGRRLKLFRLEKYLSYKKLSLLVGGGICVDTIRRAERGKRLNAVTAYKIKRLLEGVNSHA